MNRIVLNLSSDPALGAVNVSTDGSRFQVDLDTSRGILVPREATSCEVCIMRASIWNSSPNLGPALGNNLFRFTSGATHTIAVPEGLWSLTALNSFLGSEFVARGYPSSLFRLSGLDATNQTTITFANLADSIDFTIGSSLRGVLGFNSRVVTVAVAGGTAYSDSPAAFNRNDAYQVATNMCDGLQVNSQTSGVIGIIPITASPGTLINYDPRQLLWIPAPELIGSSRANLRFALVNQAGEATGTGGEKWSATMVIRYQ